MVLLVYFDLETTGFGNPDIIQIAARCKKYKFESFVVPGKPITREASEKTGFIVENRRLYRRGRKLKTVPLETALEDLLFFLAGLKIVLKDKCVLVAHNASFDARIIHRELARHALWPRFSSLVVGFADSLAILKCKLPERRRQKLSFSLEALARELLNRRAGSSLAHDASHDVRTLRDVLAAAGVTHEEIASSATSLGEVESQAGVSRNRKSLRVLEDSASGYTLDRLAKAGIGYSKLALAYQEGKLEGVESLLSGASRKHPVVIRKAEVVRSVSRKVEMLEN